MCVKSSDISLRRLVAFSLVVLLCLLSSIRAGAQTASEQTGNSIKQKSIEAWLTDSLEASAKLRQALAERTQTRQDLEQAFNGLKVQYTRLQTDLLKAIAQLKTQLAESQTNLEALQAEIDRLTSLLARSNEELSALSKAFGDYQAEMKAQVAGLETERNIWRVIAIVAGVIAGGAAVYAIAK